MKITKALLSLLSEDWDKITISAKKTDFPCKNCGYDEYMTIYYATTGRYFKGAIICPCCGSVESITQSMGFLFQ